MSTSGRLLLLLFLAWAAVWGTPARALEQQGPPVRLVAPRAGVTLVAGTTAELEWAPLAPLAGLSEVEEWEAFLSLDAGRTYPLRITPHLDQDLRRFHWQVPFLPTGDAAILLRFGNERRETAVELPVRFAIATPPTVPPGWQSTLRLARRTATRGESPLPGQPGVVAWPEGSRRGGSLRQVIATGPLHDLRERFEAHLAHREAFEAASDPLPAKSLAPARSEGAALPAGDRSLLAGSLSGPALSSDILLLIQRQNE